MLSKDVVKEVAVMSDMTQGEVKNVLDALFNVTKVALKKGEKVPFGDVGIFKVVVRKEKSCRNPQTGEVGLSPEHRVIKFSVNKNLKEEVR